MMRALVLEISPTPSSSNPSPGRPPPQTLLGHPTQERFLLIAWVANLPHHFPTSLLSFEALNCYLSLSRKSRSEGAHSDSTPPSSQRTKTLSCSSNPGSSSTRRTVPVCPVWLWRT